LEEKSTGLIEVAEFVPLAKRSIGSTWRRCTTSARTRAATARIACSLAALEDTGRAALGQYAARGRQHLVLLRPLNGVLVMEQLHYADEVRPTSEVPVPEGEVKADRAGAREAADRADVHRRVRADQVQGHRARARAGERFSARSKARRSRRRGSRYAGGKIIDLMEALKASLASAPKERSLRAEKKSRRAS
jgi:DNA end-binding protein Ku